MSEVFRLNPEQQEAVHYIDGPLLVLAGAGSGKTRVITQKIAYLIKDCGMQARHIAAVTFTNKAAKEMKARIGKILDKSLLKGLQISTFHTLGLRIIRKEHQHLGLKKNFSIFDEQDCYTLLQQLKPQGTSYGMEEIQALKNQISNWKNLGLMPETAIVRAEDAETLQQAKIYEAYQRHLKAYNALDFDDLILLPYLLFKENPERLRYWQEQFHYLLVDEYQDTNTAQYLLVQQLVDLRQTFTVVGDDDQSIYSWRGAAPENLALLQRDYPRLKLIKLEQNYRSCGNILQAANDLIDNNPHIFEKKLWSAMGAGEQINVIPCKDEFDEAKRVILDIIGHRFQNNTKYNDYAILYRSNHQAKLIEQHLREHHIPYALSGGTSYFERTEIKDMMGYLRLLANPEDDAAFLRIVNTPKRGIGATTLEKLGTYAQERQVSLFNACPELGLQERLSRQNYLALQSFHDLIKETAHHISQGTPMQNLHVLLKEIDYQNFLIDNASKPEIAEKRWENLQSFLGWFKKLMDKSEEEDLESRFYMTVNKLILLNQIEQSEDDETLDQVNLMTLHAAKGLEYPHVYLIGMEEEILPHKNSIEIENIDEERRLAYVGVTRAQHTLSLSFAEKRKRYGSWQESQPSRFLEELPNELVNWPNKTKKTAEERKAHGAAQLAQLKQLLR